MAGKSKKVSILDELRALPAAKGDWSRRLTAEARDALEEVSQAHRCGELMLSESALRYLIDRFQISVSSKGLRQWLTR